MDYLLIIIFGIGFSIILTFIRLLQADNSYEKIIGFYLIFTQSILLFLGLSKNSSNQIFDIIIIIFLLKLVAILFLLLNRKKL